MGFAAASRPTGWGVISKVVIKLALVAVATVLVKSKP
jgi:hypothetical protein